MLFNSLEFLLFLPLVFGVYWAMNGRTSLRVQNLLLLVASYVFYGWWDAKFLSLIAFSTVVDFIVGQRIAGGKRPRVWLAVSLLVNLGLLGYFKYANFFIDSWITAWAAAGIKMNASTLQIILPVGISFYTFQTLSYSIDIYRRKLEPTKDLIAFAAFVSFFPQLVAGPIERASKLLPQFARARRFDAMAAIEGLMLALWGLAKKVVIADSCAPFTDMVFAHPGAVSWEALAIALPLFGLQIYGDFSGYSDMAIGIARMFGIRLSTNFRTPYFSRSVAEFWQRWHISLSSWFRDYLYIPLGGSRHKPTRVFVNILIIFAVSGLWHGANWTFVIWGITHGVLVGLPRWIRGGKPEPQRSWWAQGLGIASTFGWVSLTWILFRSPSLGHVKIYTLRLFGLANGRLPEGWEWPLALGFGLLLIEWALIDGGLASRWARAGAEATGRRRWASWALVWAAGQILLLLTFSHLQPLANPFIYFQF